MAREKFDDFEVRGMAGQLRNAEEIKEKMKSNPSLAKRMLEMNKKDKEAANKVEGAIKRARPKTAKRSAAPKSRRSKK